MAHAETCPLCAGNGNIDGLPDNPTGTTMTCHGCGGKGWVSVEDTMYQWPVYPDYTSSGMSRFHNIDYVLVR